MKNKSFILAFLVSLSVLMLMSCVTENSENVNNQKRKSKNADYLELLNAGDYSYCIDLLKEKNERNGNRTDNYIRDYYDIAMLNHFAGNYQQSIDVMNEVDMRMKEALTVSISKTAAAAIINDNISDYAGHPYEYVYANIFNALNYYNIGDIDEAAVEIRKLNNKQKEFIVKYGEILKSYDPDADDNDYINSGTGSGQASDRKLGLSQADFDAFYTAKPEKSTEADIFKDSIAARYLSMLFYMIDKDVDSAKLDAATIKALGCNYDTSDDLAISNGQGRLNVLAFTGLIGRRGEMRRIFGPFYGMSFRVDNTLITIPPFDLEFVYPIFPAPQEVLYKSISVDVGDSNTFLVGPGRTDLIPAAPNSVDFIRLVMDDGSVIAFETLENFDDAVMHDVNTKARGAYNRSMARSITKKVATITGSSAALVAAQKSSLPLSSIFYAASVVGFAKLIDQVDVGETADIRQVYALPGKMSVAGINLPAGVYSFKVQFISNGSIVSEEYYSDVVVSSGVPTIVEVLCTK